MEKIKILEVLGIVFIQMLWQNVDLTIVETCTYGINHRNKTIVYLYDYILYFRYNLLYYNRGKFMLFFKSKII